MVLLHCHAGCRTEEVVEALGLTMRDLFVEANDIALPQAAASLRRRAPRTGRDGPSLDDVDAVWDLGRPVIDDSEVAAFLGLRGIPADRVELFDLARALPAKAALPPHFAIRGVPWSRTSHRLVFPCWSSAGQLQGLHARAVVGSSPKTLWPQGQGVKGLTLANEVALQLLRRRQLDWWSRRLVVVEGVTDFLSMATQHSDADVDAPAVLGLMSGTWSQDIASAIPNGTLVLIATDRDERGDEYAKTVADTITRRCDVRRWRP
jgi:hypothetical protein